MSLSLNTKVLNLAHWYSNEKYIPTGILPTPTEILTTKAIVIKD